MNKINIGYRLQRSQKVLTRRRFIYACIAKSQTVFNQKYSITNKLHVLFIEKPFG